MDHENVFMRRASPNEQRTISREDVGFYNAVIVGAAYDLPKEKNINKPETFFYPLGRCIEQQVWLCVVVEDKHTDKAVFKRVGNINLNQHIIIIDGSTHIDDRTAIEHVLQLYMDAPFASGIPPWKVIVSALPSGQCFIAFAYSHAISDGRSGLIFHRTFLHALRENPEEKSFSHLVETGDRMLPAPFDTPERLPISWSFLLRPLIAVLIPSFISQFLGLHTSAFTIQEGTWAPTKMFFDPTAEQTQVRVIEIEAPIVEKALQLSRKNGAKLTGTIHQLITRALSKCIANPSVTNFVAQTAMDMRQSVGIPDGEMGEFASGCNFVIPRSTASGPLSDGEWKSAQEATKTFAVAAKTLQDQAIGLLRYAPSIRKWTLGKMGEQRDCSYGVSNIGGFDGKMGVGHKTNITKVVFGHPGAVIGPVLTFNIVSVRGGSLVCAVTWQAGALGVDGEEGEFVDGVCNCLEEEFRSFD